MTTRTVRKGPARARQQGAALVVGLLLLLVLTILAISGMTTASLEMLMAGNEQYQERAFQAADSAVERAITAGIYNTNATIGDYDPPVDPNDPPTPDRGTGQTGCVQTIPADGTATTPSTDCYEYFIRFDEQSGTTPVPGGGYSLGTGFNAYHFVVDSFGTSDRDAQSDHQASFYVIGPGGS
ncbi:MAG TPA: pilus assembly PilX N-terminal domain-containing protein [Steroidobacteraceae bacterium]|jgi:type IV pilus assembly protein PilX|nr:pilus assembly PilX N-terminal domain-containing protein [Steroidobacteraceae bacterium]